jgi:hypothetical protein
MMVVEGVIVELKGHKYYVLETMGGQISKTISGAIFCAEPPTTVVLKRVIENVK